MLNNLGINLRDYQSSDLNNQVLFGNAETTQEKLSELTKALEAQEITGRETTDLTTASGAPLKVESLDKTLKVITFKESEIVLWKKIPKTPAYNTVEEYNQQASYGTDRGGFITEGELPIEEDSTYIRRAQLVKFLGVTKSVTHPMTLVNTMAGNVIDREVKAGSLWILRKLDRSLTKGDSALVPQEFNGLYAQHQRNDAWPTLNSYMDSEVVVDLRGDTMKEKYIEGGAEGIIENFGLGNEMFAPPKVFSDFVKNFYGNKFINPNTQQTAAGIMGQRVNEFDSQFGRIGLNWDIFMNKPANKVLTTPADTVNAPTAVTAGSVAIVAPTVTNSKWAAGDAGSYFYAVAAMNRFGESALTLVDAVIRAVAAGGALDLTFTDGGGANPATAYVIYRSNKGAATSAGATYYPIFTVSKAEFTAGYDGAAAGKVRDNDRWLPNCNQAFLIQNDEEVHAFKQLAPLMKMDLAIISPAYRFMVLLYGTPLLYAPKKMTRFINIGLAS